MQVLKQVGQSRTGRARRTPWCQRTTACLPSPPRAQRSCSKDAFTPQACAHAVPLTRSAPTATFHLSRPKFPPPLLQEASLTTAPSPPVSPLWAFCPTQYQRWPAWAESPDPGDRARSLSALHCIEDSSKAPAHHYTEPWRPQRHLVPGLQTDDFRGQSGEGCKQRDRPDRGAGWRAPAPRIAAWTCYQAGRREQGAPAGRARPGVCSWCSARHAQEVQSGCLSPWGSQLTDVPEDGCPRQGHGLWKSHPSTLSGTQWPLQPAAPGVRTWGRGSSPGLLTLRNTVG